jgi:hypothetical protein
MKSVTTCPENRDEYGLSQQQTVTVFVTSLFYHTHTAGGRNATDAV